MPLAQLTVPEGHLSDDAIDAVAARLTEIFVRSQGALEGSVAAPGITRIEVTELPSRRIYVGGRRTNEALLRIEFTVPAGSLDERRKAELTAQATRILLDAEGAGVDLEDDAMRVWCIVTEVPDGGWAAGGRVYRWRDIVRWVLRQDLKALRRDRRPERAAAAATQH